MRTPSTVGRNLWVSFVFLHSACLLALAQPPQPNQTVRDHLWVWGNPEMTTRGSHDLTSFAGASPAERARLLGIPNVIMAGEGLPRDDKKAEEQTRPVDGFKKIVYEIAPDGDKGGPPFVFTETIARLKRLVIRHPTIQAVLVDDMSTVKIDQGFKPEHLIQLRGLLTQHGLSQKLWGVVYTMSFSRKGIDEYIRPLDVINLWIWHAKDTPDIEKHVAHCRRTFPDKPVVLGLYLFDYGENRRMPPHLLAAQCDTALRLLHAGQISDIVFLTINDDADALARTADWIKRVGGQRIGSPATSSTPLQASQSQQPNPGDTFRLSPSDAWHFTGGSWSEDGSGVIRPPDRRNVHARAFRTDAAYTDLDAEFEFNGSYRETGTGSAGFILRATDPSHFYYVYFAWGGQQLRAKHFWAAIAKVDGSGWLRNLRMEWVPGVPSETDRWYKVRISARASRIAVWVEGRVAISVDDAPSPPGCIGLAGYGWYSFRNVRVSGTRVAPLTWSTREPPRPAAFSVGLSSEIMPSGCVAPNGDVLIAAGRLLVRSKDKGRTWSAPETLPGSLGTVGDYTNSMFRLSADRLGVLIYRPQDEIKKPQPEIALSTSVDNGRAWTVPAPAQVKEGWPKIPKNLVPYGAVIQTDDGTLLRFLLGGAKEDGTLFTDVRTWSATHCKAFVIRSADAGRTWSAPIEIDQPSWPDTARGTIPGSLDLTEPTGVAIGSRVLVLVRPVYSPMMWQCESADAGAHWDAAARVTFPGYAQSMIRTQGGAILCAHRYPHYAVNISYDNGLNWDAGTVIDYPVWAMGCMIEVEPNVVLAAYMNADRGQPLLAQILRVTDKGLTQ